MSHIEASSFTQVLLTHFVDNLSPSVQSSRMYFGPQF